MQSFFFGGVSDKHFKIRDKYCPSMKMIIDVPIALDQYVKNVLNNDINITGDVYTKIEQSATWNVESKIPSIVSKADGFLVGSSFVKKSLKYYGADENKIKIVPYGVDVSKFKLKEYSQIDKVNFIFAGLVNRRKGIQHLLPAFARIDPDRANLHIVGKYNENDKLINKYRNNANIYFDGFVLQDELVNLYNLSDVFVLPSLGEGLAQVGIEAMSCGLPIIVSENSGVNDLIVEGVEGKIVPVSDQDALYNAMKWFVDHSDKIEEMGLEAHELALKHTWEHYGCNAVRAIGEILGEA